jgi:hypothetical protein
MAHLEVTSVPRQTAAVETIAFHGHPMVRSLHPTTIEITTEERLTEKGDCILGVGAAKGCAQLSETLKTALKSDGSKVTIRILVGDESFTLTAQGSGGLELSHPHDIVIRKSRFLSGRTLAVGASAAARDVPRSMVSRLMDPRTVGAIKVEVSTP